jgi:hypothetical protein
MAKAVLITSRGNIAGTQGVTTAGSTQFWWLGQASAPGNTVEANRAIPWGVPGVLSKLYINVIANTTSAQSTVTVRKNAADTTLSVTIPAGTTGVFENTTATVSVVASDKTNYKSVSGGTGTFQFSVLSCIFDATNNCVTKLVAYPFGLTSTAATLYLPVVCTLSGTTAAEANTEHTLKVAGTAKNAYILVPTNARTTTTTFTLRKNRTDTALVFTYAAGETGAKTDTTNQISYSVDDEIDWKIVTGTGTENLNMGAGIGLEYETTTQQGFLDGGTIGASSDLTIGPNVTEYYTLGGGLMEGVTTESQAQIKPRTTLTLSNLTVYARANTITAPSTVRLRKNGADGNLVCNIGSSATGFIVDTTNTDIIGPDDLFCLKVTTGATGTTLTISQMATWGAETVTVLPQPPVSPPIAVGGRVRRVYLGKRVIEERQRKPRIIIKRIKAGKSQPLQILSAARLMLLDYDQPGVTLEITGVVKKKPQRRVTIRRTKLPASSQRPMTLEFQRLVIVPSPASSGGVTVAFNSLAVLNASQIGLRMFDINKYDQRTEKLQRLYKLLKITSYFESGQN